MPVPSAVACWKPSVEITSTRPGLVWLATSAAVRVPDPEVAQAVPPAARASAEMPPTTAMTRRRDRRGCPALGPSPCQVAYAGPE